MRLLSIFFTWFQRILFSRRGLMISRVLAIDILDKRVKYLWFHGCQRRKAERLERGASNFVSSAYNFFSKIFL